MKHSGWAFVRRNMERHEGGHASSRDRGDGSDTSDGRWLRIEAPPGVVWMVSGERDRGGGNGCDDDEQYVDDGHRWYQGGWSE